MSGCNTGCNQANVKDTLDATDAVIVEDRCRNRGVEAAYFRSRLVDNIALAINGQVLTVTLTFADGSTKAANVTLP